MEKIKVAVVGTGNICRSAHMPAYKKRDDVEIIACADIDFEKAKKIITDICNAHELVLKDQPIFVRVGAHGASSIDIITRVWVNSGDYWTVNFDIIEAVKTAFDKEGIEIPFNQLVVHQTQD